MRVNEGQDMEQDGNMDGSRGGFGGRVMKTVKRKRKWNYHSTKKRPAAANGLHMRRNKRSF